MISRYERDIKRYEKRAEEFGHPLVSYTYKEAAKIYRKVMNRYKEMRKRGIDVKPDIRVRADDTLPKVVDNLLGRLIEITEY